MFGPRRRPRPTAVDGLTVVDDVISANDEQRLLCKIDQLDWNTSIKRRTQHYGWRYDYETKTASPTTPIPRFIEDVYLTLRGLNLTDDKKPLDQVIVNEYLPGQGIGPHTDARYFGDTITTLSLGSATMIDYELKDRNVPVWVLPRSVTVMRDKARHQWTHGIAGKKYDRRPGTESRIRRGRRVSITFRQLKAYVKNTTV